MLVKLIISIIEKAIGDHIPFAKYKDVVESVVEGLVSEWSDDDELTPAEIAKVLSKAFNELAKVLPGAEKE